MRPTSPTIEEAKELLLQVKTNPSAIAGDTVLRIIETLKIEESEAAENRNASLQIELATIRRKIETQINPPEEKKWGNEFQHRGTLEIANGGIPTVTPISEFERGGDLYRLHYLNEDDFNYGYDDTQSKKRRIGENDLSDTFRRYVRCVAISETDYNLTLGSDIIEIIRFRRYLLEITIPGKDEITEEEIDDFKVLQDGKGVKGSVRKNNPEKYRAFNKRRYIAKCEAEKDSKQYFKQYKRDPKKKYIVISANAVKIGKNFDFNLDLPKLEEDTSGEILLSISRIANEARDVKIFRG